MVVRNAESISHIFRLQWCLYQVPGTGSSDKRIAAFPTFDRSAVTRSMLSLVDTGFFETPDPRAPTKRLSSPATNKQLMELHCTLFYLQTWQLSRPSQCIISHSDNASKEPKFGSKLLLHDRVATKIFEGFG